MLLQFLNCLLPFFLLRCAFLSQQPSGVCFPSPQAASAAQPPAALRPSPSRDLSNRLLQLNPCAQLLLQLLHRLLRLLSPARASLSPTTSQLSSLRIQLLFQLLHRLLRFHFLLRSRIPFQPLLNSPRASAASSAPPIAAPLLLLRARILSPTPRLLPSHPASFSSSIACCASLSPRAHPSNHLQLSPASSCFFSSSTACCAHFPRFAHHARPLLLALPVLRVACSWVHSEEF